MSRTHQQNILDALIVAIEAEFPGALAEITEVTLQAPVEYEVRRDGDDPRQPMLRWQTLSAEYEDYFSPFRDITIIGQLVLRTIHLANAANTERVAGYYCSALDAAFTRAVYVPGVLFATVLGHGSNELSGGDRWRREVWLEGSIKIRTTREE